MLKSTSTKLFLLMTALAASGCQLENIEKPVCEIGETKCKEDHKQLKCQVGEDHKAYWAETAAPCGEECNQDEATCDGNNLTTCNNHQIIKTECEYGCVTTETNAYCRECKDNERKCEKGFIVSCTKDGENIGKWDDDHKQRCENSCFPGARGNGSEVSCYECNTDTPKCFKDDETKVTTIKRCLAHNWYDEEVCALGCVEGTEAKCKLCNHGDKKYYNNEDGYCVEQECKDNQYQDVKTAEVSCNSDLSGPGECLNGQSRCFDKGNEQSAFQYCENGAWKEFGIPCDSNNPCAVLGNNKCIGNNVGQICSDDGKSLVACPNNASCKSDFSGCAECQSGTSKCDGNKLSTCQNGEYQETECKTGTHCEEKDGKAQCVQHDCENGQKRCQDNIIQTCENYKWKTTDACADGYSCYQSVDEASCRCGEKGDECDDNYEICQDGACQRKSCKQDLSICDGKKCRGTECYSSSTPLICYDDRVIKLWLDHYAAIDMLMHPQGKDKCDIYNSIHTAIANDGTILCNKMKECGNPKVLEKCIPQVVFELIGDNSLVPDGYDNHIDVTQYQTVLGVQAANDYSNCIQKCETDSDCTKYQQCNTKKECVRKPCGRYAENENICGDGYKCVNDVCLMECQSEDSKCASKKRITSCENGYIQSKLCDEDEHCVKEGASVACVEEDN